MQHALRIFCILFCFLMALPLAEAKGMATTFPPTEKGKELPVAAPLVPAGMEDFARQQQMQKAIAALPAGVQFRQFETLEAVAFEAFQEHDFFRQEGFLPSGNPLDSAQYYIARAREVLGKIRETQNFIHFLDASSKVELPVGITQTIGGLEYTIGIAAIRLTPTHAEFDAFMEFVMPQNGKVLTFMGRGIKFSSQGGIVGDARLELVADYAINFSGDKGQLILKGTQESSTGTFVSMDCYGFKEMGLDAEVQFSRDMLLPEMPDGSIGEGRMATRFTTSLSDWNDLIVSVSLPAFQVPSAEGVGFTVNNAVFDFSDVRNAPNVVFPQNYESPALLAGTPELWRGFYLRELSIRLPEQFKNKEHEGRTEFAAYDLLIDNMGFSGLFTARELFNLEQGDMNGWAFSVSGFSMELQANQLVGAGFSGQVVVPMADRSTPFGYEAFINPGNEYIFSVSPAENMQFPLWQAGEVEIYPASMLEVRVVNKKFLPKAILHGRMNISAGSEKLSLAEISFEELQIQSVKPYVSVGAFSLGSESAQQALGGFPLSISNIGLVNPAEGQMGIKFDATLSLVGEKDGGFGGTAGLVVIGRLQEGEGYQHWKYERVDISKIAVDFSNGAMAVKGSLEWYKKDPVYGDGIRGEAMLDVIDQFKVEAVALFGSRDDMRYWFVDALATLPPGAGQGIELRSFGGGAYYHMAQATSGGTQLGRSLSGITYLPDASVGIGLKATVGLATQGSDEIFNGDATLEIAFFEEGGLKSVDLRGNGYFVTPPMAFNLDDLQARAGKLAAKTAETAIDFANPRAQISATMHINYDTQNKTLHGNFEVFVNVAMGVVKGIGERNRAGWAVIHASPDEWYIHIGTPTDPLGLKMLGGVVQTESYIMAGHNIPASPAPPSNVSSILGDIDLDYMDQLNALGEGKGIAFGSRFNMDTGDLNFLMFYARFAAGMGFDVMVKDYGSSSCVGREGPIGINGWYANGQAFAYFEGKVGIKVKVFGKNQQFEILQIGAAAILQAKLPNPFWMRGIVGGRFNVLNGLVKGNCKFEVIIGEECQIEGGSALEGMQVIAQLTPANNEKKVSVFNAPQAVFNMEVEKEFELMDLDNQKKTFKIVLDHFKIMDGEAVIDGGREWNYEGDVLAFNPSQVLPSEKKLTAKVQISFAEKKGTAWVPVKVNGQTVIETKEVKFTTDVEPDYIPMHNVAYSYPVVNQLNFHKDEVSYGYIQLNTAQVKPFQVPRGFKQQGRFKTAGGQGLPFNFTYDKSKGLISFQLPSGMQNDKIYSFELLNVPVAAAGAVDQNVDTQNTAVALNASIDSLEMNVRSRKAEGQIDLLQEKSIFAAYFKSSKYATFSQKVSALQFSPAWSWPVEGFVGVHEVGIDFEGSELFDKYEVSKQEGFDALVQFEAVLDNNWYKSAAGPLIYSGYTASGLKLSWRTESAYGVPPVKAAFIAQVKENNELTDAAVDANLITTEGNTGSFVYRVPLVAYQDFVDLRTQASAKSSIAGKTYLVNLVEGSFPSIYFDTYKLRLKYTLPGKQTSVYQKEVHMKIE